MPPTLVRYWGSYFKSGREGQRIASYFRDVAAAGWTCHLVCCREPDDLAWTQPALEAGVSLHYMPRASGNFDRGVMRRTATLCRTVRADVFHCDNTHTSPLVGAWLARVPVRIWTKHAMEPAFEAVREPTRRARLAPSLRLSCALATRVLPISRAIEAELVARGISEDKLQLLPLPILSPEPGRHAAAVTGRVVFGTVGRAVPVKGWDVLLRAFAQVAQRNSGAHLRLVGSTSASDERSTFTALKAFVESEGLDDRVTFAGHSTDVPSELAKMDVFVLPSRSEGYSLALLEALQAGLPVVSSRVGVATEVIDDGRNGLLVDREDVGALTDVLTRIAEDGSLRNRLATGALTALESTPTADEHAAALLELYESLLTGRERNHESRPAADGVQRERGQPFVSAAAEPPTPDPRTPSASSRDETGSSAS
jgi:glycosyltransferase involved in cell wall biosynthesis